MAVDKTFVLTTGPRGTEWKVGNSGEKLEKTMTAKYLEILRDQGERKASVK